MIKMKELIKKQNSIFRENFGSRLNEQPSPPAAGKEGGEQPPKPQKLKIDIPQTPFEPDVNQVKDELKKILKQWEIKQYPSDQHRWREYYKDILRVVKTLDGDK